MEMEIMRFLKEYGVTSLPARKARRHGAKEDVGRLTALKAPAKRTFTDETSSPPACIIRLRG